MFTRFGVWYTYLNQDVPTLAWLGHFLMHSGTRTNEKLWNIVWKICNWENLNKTSRRLSWYQKLTSCSGPTPLSLCKLVVVGTPFHLSIFTNGHAFNSLLSCLEVEAWLSRWLVGDTVPLCYLVSTFYCIFLFPLTWCMYINLGFMIPAWKFDDFTNWLWSINLLTI